MGKIMLKHPFLVGDKVVRVSKHIRFKKDCPEQKIGSVHVVSGLFFYDDTPCIHLIGGSSRGYAVYHPKTKEIHYRKLDEMKKENNKKQEQLINI